MSLWRIASPVLRGSKYNECLRPDRIPPDTALRQLLWSVNATPQHRQQWRGSFYLLGRRSPLCIFSHAHLHLSRLEWSSIFACKAAVLHCQQVHCWLIPAKIAPSQHASLDDTRFLRSPAMSTIAITKAEPGELLIKVQYVSLNPTDCMLPIAIPAQDWCIPTQINTRPWHFPPAKSSAAISPDR